MITKATILSDDESIDLAVKAKQARIARDDLTTIIVTCIDRAFSDYEIKKSKEKLAAAEKIHDKHARRLDTALAVGFGMSVGYLLCVLMRLAA